jgi:hypothetical protein
MQRRNEMGYMVKAKITTTAWINVSASDPKEAEIEAAATSPLDWEIEDGDFEIVEVLHSEPNGPDYEPDVMFSDVMN